MKLGQPGRLPSGLTGQGVRFAIVGSLATVVQLGLYAFLSSSVGAQLGNILAWLVSTLAGNAAHQRYTFQVAGGSTESDHLVACDGVVRRNSALPGRVSAFGRSGMVGLLTSLAGLGISSLVLDVLGQPTGPTGTIALVAVNSAVGALRFVTLHQWFGRAVTSRDVIPLAVTPLAVTPQVEPGFASAGR